MPPTKQMTSPMRFILLLVFFAPLMGCSLFLPGHSRSGCVAGERIEIDLITTGSFSDATFCGSESDYSAEHFKADYKAAFDVDPPTAGGAGAPAAPVEGAVLAGAVVGFLVDYVKARIEEESDRYRAQYSSQVASEQFWLDASNRKPNVVGFRIRRYWGAGLMASEIVVGLCLSADGTMFRACPLSLIIFAAKAKVLSDEWRWVPVPTAWIRYAMGSTGHEVAANLGLEMTGYWVDDKKGLHVEKLAALDLRLPDYDLEKTPRLRTSSNDDGGKLVKQLSGWLLAPPISGARGRGVFDLAVVVTEHDPSNAKQWLDKLAKRLGEEKESIVKKVVP